MTTAADDADNASDQAGSNDVKTGFPVKILLIVIGILVAAAALTGGGIWFMRKQKHFAAKREDSVSWPKAVTLRPSLTDCLKRSGRGTRRDGRDKKQIRSQYGFCDEKRLDRLVWPLIFLQTQIEKINLRLK